ncbi:hypothetical protein WCLE_009830 [Wolbachia endosymbiont of Cimex lectularius]|nr:hypothetical protein WCLE_009830 [Wolbachia endosymbiont of Cimex lectularius]
MLRPNNKPAEAVIIGSLFPFVLCGIFASSAQGLLLGSFGIE